MMTYAILHTYIIHENEILYLKLHKTVIMIKQIVINGKCDSYKWYRTNINASYVINNYMFSHIYNFNQVPPN